MRILALLNLISKVYIGNKSLKRSIMNLLKLHSEAEGAGVGKASGGVSKIVNRFDNTLQSSIFADSFIQAVESVGRKPRHSRKLAIKP